MSVIVRGKEWGGLNYKELVKVYGELMKVFCTLIVTMIYYSTFIKTHRTVFQKQCIL
jgi:amino acid permease